MTVPSLEVIDNFLPEDLFYKMQEQICGDQCFPLVSESREGDARCSCI